MPKTDYELVAEPRPNMVEIDRILDYIIDNPDEWDQDAWYKEEPCGTTMCFAGHAVAAAGYTFKWQGSNGWILYRPDDSYAAGVSWEACKVLGLTVAEGDRLFLRTMHPTKERSLEAVKVEVEKIRGRAKLQDEAFNRLAQEFIDAAGLDTVDLTHCPDSAFVQGLRGGEQN